MSPIAFLLNLLWILFGGLWMALGWVIAAVIMAITIIGLPWARAAFNIASYTLLPFGRRAVSRAEYSGRHDLGTGPFGLLGNIIWLVFAGWWLALGHVLTAIVLAVTIIGIPFAWAHLKLAGIALWPIGKEIVAAEAVPFSRSTAEGQGRPSLLLAMRLSDETDIGASRSYCIRLDTTFTVKASTATLKKNEMTPCTVVSRRIALSVICTSETCAVIATTNE